MIINKLCQLRFGSSVQPPQHQLPVPFPQFISRPRHHLICLNGAKLFLLLAAPRQPCASLKPIYNNGSALHIRISFSP